MQHRIISKLLGIIPSSLIMSDNVIILQKCSVGLRSWCNTNCLQPYTASVCVRFYGSNPTLPFLKVFIITCFPAFFKIIRYSVIIMYCIAIIIWKMGKRLKVNWLNACTVPEKFRSIAHSPEEKELTEGDSVLRAAY